MPKLLIGVLPHLLLSGSGNRVPLFLVLQVMLEPLFQIRLRIKHAFLPIPEVIADLAVLSLLKKQRPGSGGFEGPLVAFAAVSASW